MYVYTKLFEIITMFYMIYAFAISNQNRQIIPEIPYKNLCSISGNNKYTPKSMSSDFFLF